MGLDSVGKEYKSKSLLSQQNVNLEPGNLAFGF